MYVCYYCYYTPLPSNLANHQGPVTGGGGVWGRSCCDYGKVRGTIAAVWILLCWNPKGREILEWLWGSSYQQGVSGSAAQSCVAEGDIVRIEAVWGGLAELISFHRNGILNMTQKDVYVIHLDNVRAPNHCENLTYSISTRHCRLHDVLGAGMQSLLVCFHSQVPSSICALTVQLTSLCPQISPLLWDQWYTGMDFSHPPSNRSVVRYCTSPFSKPDSLARLVIACVDDCSYFSKHQYHFSFLSSERRERDQTPRRSQTPRVDCSVSLSTCYKTLQVFTGPLVKDDVLGFRGLFHTADVLPASVRAANQPPSMQPIEMVMLATWHSLSV